MSRLPTAGMPSTVSWEGDLTPPVTTYASNRAPTGPNASLHIPPSRNTTNSAVVVRRQRRNGLNYWYSHGGIQMPLGHAPTPGAGGVRNSMFQQTLVQLHDWVINTAWFAAGYPRNLGLSFRVGQPQTNVTGGPTSAVMEPRPLFPKVQTVPRATVVTPRYPTRSARA